MSSYGTAGKTYINWCANMAESLDIGVPWIMCQQDDAPESMVCFNYSHVKIILIIVLLITILPTSDDILDTLL